ncbi:uncharacterized protein LOC135486756 [Lineus longissimus]|uniref:uncharacterized protein LOC135486756 n=1 Tax=Lineus longissimus TaxID=88925 RepID=UPI00315D88FA
MTVLDHVENQRDIFPKAVTEITENIFVDDVLTGDSTVEEASVLALALKTVLGSGGWPPSLRSLRNGSVIAKQIFQRSWLTGLDWTEPVPEDLEQQWLRWKNEVPDLDEIKVARCLIPDDFTTPTYTLHGFGDASEAAYGAAVYLREADTGSDRVHTALLCAKTRVVPVGKRRTIPELELMAALINARLINYVEKELKLKIDDKVEICPWEAKSSGSLFKRNISECLGRSNIVVDGPSFLRSDEEWPSQPVVELARIEEAEKKSKHKIGVFSVTESDPDEPDQQENLVKRFSSLQKFIRVMTIVRSWLKHHREKKTGLDEGSVDEGSIGVTVTDREEEVLKWIQWAQRKNFREEIESLKRGENVPKNSKLGKLDSYWDDEKEVLRVGGRLQYSKLPEETRTPSFFQLITISLTSLLCIIILRIFT